MENIYADGVNVRMLNAQLEITAKCFGDIIVKIKELPTSEGKS